MAYTKEQFAEKIKTVPNEVKEALFAESTAAAISAIAENHKLHIDKQGLLVDEITAIMLGDTHPQEFVANLQKRLEVDQATAEAIAKEVNEQIFLPIRESLKKVHHIGATKEELEPAKVEKGYVLKAIEEPETLPMASRTIVPPPPPPPTESQPAISQESKVVGNTQKITIDPYKEQL